MITNNFFKFFAELESNNNKEWFDSNKKRYEKDVKNPFLNLVGQVIEELNNQNQIINIQPKDAIFRINRDVRFSNDKTPYKTQASALISKNGKKDTASPGLYFEIGAKGMTFYGGSYMPDKEQLSSIRNYIAGNLDIFNKIINDKIFKQYFGEIQGDKNKIIPKDLADAAKIQPLIFNKSFYYTHEVPKSNLLKESPIKIILELQDTSKDIREFLAKAIG